MNQILSIENKKGKKSSGNPIEITKIVRFFSIAILIFGLFMIGQGSYGIVKNIEDNKASVGGKNNAPEVTIERVENTIHVKATHDKEITKMVYSWNDNGIEVTINGNGTNTLEQKIDLPIGNNTFHIKVYDILDRERTYEKEYVTDATAPQVSIEVVGNNIKITAKDTTALSYITYRWDEEEETKVDATEESNAQIEQEIEIPVGQHKLTVVAVNTNNKTTTKEQEVKGVIKPKLDVAVDANDPSYVIISGTDENAMKEVSFNINNGTTYRLDYSTVREKRIEYRMQVSPGENIIRVKGVNFDGVEVSIDRRYVYNP